MDDDDLLRPGTVVETSYGVGVVVQTTTTTTTEEEEEEEDTDNMVATVHVRLWRLPGRSVGTCASAYFHPSAVRVLLVVGKTFCFIIWLLKRKEGRLFFQRGDIHVARLGAFESHRF